MNTGLQVCKSSLARNSKSFSLAARLLPEASAEAAAVVYAWCRRADDAVDLSPAAEQAERVVELRSELQSIYAGASQSDAILAEFQSIVMRYGIPRRYPTELLDGMQMDVVSYEYLTWNDLLLYSYCVASTVGLMMCRVFGVTDSRAYQHAAHLGIGMQLTNIARDVGEDWTRHRLYIPAEVLEQVGADPSLRRKAGGLISKEQARQLATATQVLVQRSAQYYESGRIGLRYLDFRTAVAVGSAGRIYSRIGVEAARNDFDPLAPRAVVSGARKSLLALRGLADAVVSRWAQPEERADAAARLSTGLAPLDRTGRSVL